VVLIVGEGSLQMTVQEIGSYIRYGLKPIIFVINNGVYGVEQWLADSSVFHTDKAFYRSCILHQWNYSKLAEVFGCQGWKAGTYGELEDAVTGALANSSSPSIIQVLVPDKSIPDNADWKTR